MNITKQTLIALAVLALVGCSTSPIAPRDARDATAESVITHKSPIANGGAITVVRDKGGSPCHAGVFVGGELAARIGKGERIKLYLPAGRSVVSARLVGEGLCGIKLQERGERAVAVQIAAGDDFTYRIASPGNGEMTVTPLN